MAGIAEQESPLSTARGKVAYATERVSKLTFWASEIADVMFGPQPPQPGSVEKEMHRDGEAGLLHDDLDTLARQIDWLETQLTRLMPLGIRNPEPAMPTGYAATTSAGGTARRF